MESDQEALLGIEAVDQLANLEVAWQQKKYTMIKACASTVGALQVRVDHAGRIPVEDPQGAGLLELVELELQLPGRRIDRKDPPSLSSLRLLQHLVAQSYRWTGIAQ